MSLRDSESVMQQAHDAKIAPSAKLPVASGAKASVRSGPVCAMVFLLGLAFCSLTLGSTLFDYYEQVFADGHRRELQRELGLSLRPGIRPGNLRPERLSAVRTLLTPMFKVLPKNKVGRISAAVMRSVANRYFVHKYGWYVKGFESHKGNNDTELSHAHVLRSKVPGYCESALEGRLAMAGFALDDAATLVAGVEQLIFDEDVANVELAYGINNFPVTKSLPKQGMRSVIDSVLIESFLEGDFSNKVEHQGNKDNIFEIYPNWQTTSLFVDDVISADAFERKQTSNPFARGAQQSFAFEDTARVATRISEDFGQWVNHECRSMKQALIQLDKHSTGRVKLADFYGASQGGAWQFLESIDYLRSLGALDEPNGTLGPQVIISNYILGANNCIMNTPHYSVCCINECEGVLRQIENRIDGPTGSVSAVREAVFLVTAVPVIPVVNGSLVERLEEIAAHNGGSVPIHGRFFAQFLHYAFPHECPYPHAPGTLDPRSPLEMIKTVGEEAIVVQDADLKAHLELGRMYEPPSAKAGENMWVAHEELLTSTTPSDEVMGWCAQLARTALSLSLIAVMVAAVMRARADIKHLARILFPALEKGDTTNLLAVDAAAMA